MLKLLTGFFLGLVLLCGAGPGSIPSAHGQVLEQTFTDDTARFKISTPNPHWHLEPRGSAPGAQRALILFETPLHQFVPNVTVRVSLVEDANAKLEDLVQKETQSLPKTIASTDQKKLTLEGMKGYELSWKDPESGVFFLQWLFLAKGRSYLLTCAAKEDSYARLMNDFRQILNSFQIL